MKSRQSHIFISRSGWMAALTHRFALIGWGVVLLLTTTLHLFGQTRATCLTCHSDHTLTKEKDGKQISIFVDEQVLDKSPHKKLVCVACHTGFDPDNVPHKEKITPVNCLTCHSDVPRKHTFHPQLAEAISQNQVPDVGCKDCHGTHNIVSPKVSTSKFNETNIAEGCGECHGDKKEAFDESAHGVAIKAGNHTAPNCLTCHRHDITGIDSTHDSLYHKIAQEKLCLSCHRDNANTHMQNSPTAGFIAAYEKSVHGKALLGGNPRVANCIDCHGSHEMKKGSDPTSFVNKHNIPETCGKCHTDVVKEYNQSIHGVAFAKGNHDAPVCTDCHGEHTILAPSDPNSRVASNNVSTQVCSPCHSSVKLSEKFGLPSDRFQTFSDSYHGLANRSGNLEAANCASCHGAHNIKKADDSTSTVNKKNLSVTCGKCHPGANEKFSVGSVHLTLTETKEPILYWISNLYIILIVVVIGGMFLHNLLDFIKKSKRRLMLRRGLIHEEHVGHRLYLRMSGNERFQHATLLLSFFTLVFTGFALKFPEAWWVVYLRDVSPYTFTLRGIIHRIAGVAMVLASIYHLSYLFFTERGKQLLKDLLPKIQDIYDAIAVLKYNLGFSKIKPQFGRFSYIEKSEYWALVWGTIVMAATGVILWFDNTFLGMLTKLWWDAAGEIHYYEAWLATLAIIVWHFYFVIFNPDIYPINLAFWKGTLTEEEMNDEHPLELKKIKKAEYEEEVQKNENEIGEATKPKPEVAKKP